MATVETKLIETPIPDIPQIVKRVREGYRNRLSWSESEQRNHTMTQLKALKKLMKENTKQIYAALKADLNKCEVDSALFEYNVVFGDVVDTIRDYDEWVKPRHVSKSLSYILDECYVKPEPYGVVLIVGAWNYPFHLVTLPLLGAIAAGNAIIVKPSEVSVHTSNLFADLIPKYLDQDFYAVISGGVDVATAILKEQFDYIFYTGSTSVGKIVMKAAAEYLTPVTLELGGKSPVIIAEDANIEVSANRIIWGKLANVGQTCISPDYVLCSSKIYDRFVECCKDAAKRYYGEDPLQSPDYGRMVNGRHFNRVARLMDTTKGQVVLGGQRVEDEKYIAPSIYANVTEDDILMNEEIFGPLLPVMKVSNLEEAVQYVNSKERPLAFYVFTESKKTFEYIANHTCTGSISQNHTLKYAGLNSLPFGGIGGSGMGAYHGKHTFDTFSHMKPVLRSPTKLESLNKMMYPPHFPSKMKQMRFLQIPSSRRTNWSRYLFLVLIVGIAIILRVYGIPEWILMLFRRQL